MRKYIVTIIASLALFTGQAHAQRCLPKMQGIEVRANMADGFNPGGNDGGYSFGAALSTYTKKGNKWVFGGEYLLKNNPYKDGKIPVAQFTAEGGYYFKILSDARKIVFVYAVPFRPSSPIHIRQEPKHLHRRTRFYGHRKVS